ncbi:MAG: hypothetical protein AABW61_00450, partial [Candidatus Aenigmatarchaeota archaeon]
YYINLRPILSWREATNDQRKELVHDIVNGYLFLLENYVGLDNMDIVLSIPKASQMYAGAFSYATGISVGYVEDLKGHGIQTYVEGFLRDGDRIVLLDDLITTARSKKDALDKVEKQAQQDGINVTSENVAVLFDRMQGGIEELAKHRSPISPNGVRVHSLITALDMLEILYGNRLITYDEYQTTKNYIVDPPKLNP